VLRKVSRSGNAAPNAGAQALTVCPCNRLTIRNQAFRPPRL